MFGEIDEHDEGECDADVGLALDRCADELDQGVAPQPGFLKDRAGTNRPVRWGCRRRSRRQPFSAGAVVLHSLKFFIVWHLGED